MHHHHLRASGFQLVGLAEVTNGVEAGGSKGIVETVLEGIAEAATLSHSLTQGRAGEVLHRLVGGEATGTADGTQVHRDLAGIDVGLGVQHLVEVLGGQVSRGRRDGVALESTGAGGVLQPLPRSPPLLMVPTARLLAIGPYTGPR